MTTVLSTTGAVGPTLAMGSGISSSPAAVVEDYTVLEQAEQVTVLTWVAVWVDRKDSFTAVPLPPVASMRICPHRALWYTCEAFRTLPQKQTLLK